MLAGVMLRFRRPRNYVVVALALTLVTYLTLLQRDGPFETSQTMASKVDGALTPEPANHDDTSTTTNTNTTPDTPAMAPLEATPEDVANATKTPLIPSDEASRKLVVELPVSYGTASRPAFREDSSSHPDGGGSSGPGIADLPRKHLPSAANRLVIVGDVHGQLDALQRLLDAVAFDRKTDHLVLAGDLVAKGPDSAGVVRLAMDLGASAVRGNHEDRVLLAHAEARARRAAGTTTGGNSGWGAGWLSSLVGTGGGGGDDDSATSSTDETPPDPDADPTAAPNPGAEAEMRVAAQLSAAQLAWLASLPVILRLGPLAAAAPPWNAGTVAVVHAGLVPGVPLEAQDRRAAMNTRSLVFPAEEIRRDMVREQLERDLRARMERTARGRKVTGYLEIRDELIEAEMKRLEEEMGWDRRVDRRVWFPVDGREGAPWSEVWSLFQSGIKSEADRTVVVYGHDAKAGLRVGEVEEVKAGPEIEGHDGTAKVERYAFGLDSGCVYGRQLSALVLEMGEEGSVVHRIVQVDCPDAAAAAPPAS